MLLNAWEWSPEDYETQKAYLLEFRWDKIGHGRGRITEYIGSLRFLSMRHEIRSLMSDVTQEMGLLTSANPALPASQPPDRDLANFRNFRLKSSSISITPPITSISRSQDCTCTCTSLGTTDSDFLCATVSATCSSSSHCFRPPRILSTVFNFLPLPPR